MKIADAPSRAPHRFVYLRNLPEDADPWDEKNWFHSNPALGDLLSLSALREEALEALNDPARENSFRQYGIDGHPSVLWRFWLQETGVSFLDDFTEGRVSRWVDQGWITVTDGEVIDYDVIEDDVPADTGLLRVADISYDEWSGEPVRQRLERRTGVPMYPVPQTY